MSRLLGGTMPFPPAPGVPAARPPPRRPCAAPAPPLPAVGEKRRPEAHVSSSWPSATLKRPPARRGPGAGRTQPSTPSRTQLQASPGRAGAPATCATPRRARATHSPAGAAVEGTSAGAEAGPGDAVRFSLSLTPEAILVIQRRHLERELLARPRRPCPSPSAGPRRPPVPCPRARASARPAPRAPLLPGGPQVPTPGPRPADPRPLLKVSLLNERHKYDDVEYEEEVRVADEGLVRRCTEWLRGVEAAAAARGRHARLASLPHVSTL